MSQLRSSLAYSAIDSYFGTLLQIVSTLVIARLLSPEQTGVFAVAAVFASLASALRDFGVAEYLIQEKQLNDDAIRAALTVNIATSWTMAALMWAAAPLAAGFYNAPGVAAVMSVQALNFLLIPFGAVTLAWFRREMNFKPIFIANLTGNLTGFAVAMGLALLGFGAMSLAWSSVASIATTVAAATILRPQTLPRWPGTRGIGRVFHFGKFASGVTIFGQLGKGAPEMIIGRAADMAAVGIFSRGAGLVEVFNKLVLRVVMLVALPYFASSVREEGSPRRAMLLSMTMITGVGWPFLAFMGVAAYSVVALMYGSQWLAAVPLAQILCAAAALELAYFPAKEAMLAMGLPRASNHLQMLVQALRAMGLLLVIPYGLEGAAWGLMVAAGGGAFLSHRYLARHSKVTVADVINAAVPSAVVTLASIVPFAAWLAFAPLDQVNYVHVGIVGGGLCLASWVFALKLARHPLWPELQRAWKWATRRTLRG